MKPTVECLEVISPKVQITDSFIETDYEYQTSQVKRLPNGKIQVCKVQILIFSGYYYYNLKIVLEFFHKRGWNF